MALKGDRVEHLTDISFFKNDTVAERGIIVVHSTGGSGHCAFAAGHCVDQRSPAKLERCQPGGRHRIAGPPRHTEHRRIAVGRNGRQGGF